MKVVLLAGGFGTRLSEYTESIPKPMVTIGRKPILWHIMGIYARYGFSDFYLALGYKAEVIKEYFLHYRSMNSDFSLNLGSGKITYLQQDESDWNVTLVDTETTPMTGGRLKRMQRYIGHETFLMSYGDGVADIDIKALLDFHRQHGKMVTVTAVHPGARFGELEMEESGVVTSFMEKPQTGHGWINGGFFVFEPEFFDLIENDATILEKTPLERATAMGELMAYRHKGYWQCMDTKRDRDVLEGLWQSGAAPWAK
ncbi:MAG: glucose-1-phosphate cytidylyltransferase [Gammaproteobacteria bacterium]|nr:glucose-1-phosphate cytidylyltransferase [Gammaproteobacteria bacterium]